MKKEYNNKYSVDFLFKEILPVLRQFKNRRQLSKKFTFIDAFPTSENSNQNDELIIELPTYLNALKIYALFYRIIENVNSDFNNNRQLNSSSHYLQKYLFQVLDRNSKDKKLCFKNIYSNVKNDEINILRFFDNPINEQFESDLNWCDSKLNYLFATNLKDWNFLNNNIKQCFITGLFFRKNDCLSVHQDYKFRSNKHHLKNRSFGNLAENNNTNEIYIYKDFIRNFGNRFCWYIDEIFVIENCECEHYNDNSLDCECDNDRVYQKENKKYQFLYVNELKCCVSEYDSEILKNYNIIALASNNNQLRNYSFPVHKHLPIATLKSEKEKKELLIGLEIECSYRSTCKMSSIHKRIEENYLQGLAICKSDSSVQNGFELNFVPMTFNYIKRTDLFFKFYENIKNELSSYHNKSTGIHIHLSKNSFTRLQIGKIVEFINSPINRKYIIELSQRNPNTYCEVLDTLKIKDYAKKNSNNYGYLTSNKYSAVNLCHKDTIELRIFKGNLKPQAISRFIEFAHCLAMFVKQNKLNELEYKDFIKFTYKNKNIYPFLNEFNYKYSTQYLDKYEIESLFYKKKFNLKENYSYKFRVSKYIYDSEIPKLQCFSNIKIKRNRKIINRS